MHKVAIWEDHVGKFEKDKTYKIKQVGVRQ